MAYYVADDEQPLVNDVGFVPQPVVDAHRAIPSADLPNAPSPQFVIAGAPLPPSSVDDRFRALPQDKAWEYVATEDNFTVSGVGVATVLKAYQRYAPHSPAMMTGEGIALVSNNRSVPERYHWRGLLAQSLFFNVTENTFRIASDSHIRNFLAHKPFWRDYAASLTQYNMRRWNDGDPFLVNDVGHPIQGAVSGFIEIQNDPRQRDLRLGMNHEYWKSRFKAFLWATVYSTHSEISPLGEAGIGSQGDWTYPINCKNPCMNPRPKVVKYTNNTGWTDFIITPTSECCGSWLRTGSTSMSATESRASTSLDRCRKSCAVH